MEKIIAIMGTTASGKSSLGIELAKYFGGEIVSADSRQVYVGLDLGSGKVTQEEQKEAPHHLLDVVKVNESFSVAVYQKMAYEKIDEIIERKKPVFLVGGTGLYVRAVTDGYNFTEIQVDEKRRAELESKSFQELKNILLKLEPNCGVDFANVPKRRIVRLIEKLEQGVDISEPNNPRYEVLKIGIQFDKDILDARIKERLEIRIKDGMIEEISNLVKNGATREFMLGLGLEYRHTYLYITGEYSTYEEYFNSLYYDICQFAKRQKTWFRKEKDLHWLNEKGDYLKEAIELCKNFLAK